MAFLTGITPKQFQIDAVFAADFVNDFYRVGAGPGYATGFLQLPGLSISSPATYAETAAGLLVPQTANMGRRTDKGLLVEESRTNLLWPSEDASSARYTKTDATVSTDVLTAPNGAVTMDLVTEGSAGTASLVTPAITITASQSTANSVYLKYSNCRWLRLVYLDATGTDGFTVWVDVLNGVIGTTSARGSGTFGSASIAAAANGSWRVSFAGIASTRTSVQFYVISAAADNSTTRVSGAAYGFWGGQQEANATFATSYIPTTSASVTRAVDDVHMTIAPPAGDFIVYGTTTITRAATTGNRRFIEWNDGSTSNRIIIQLTTSNLVSLVLTNSGSNTTIGPEGGSPAVARTIKWLARKVGGDWSLFVAGALVATSTVATPTLTTLQFGATGTVVNLLNDYLGAVTVTAGTFTDAACQTLTT